MTCKTVDFTVDAAVEGLQLLQIPYNGLVSRLLSPNGDGVQDVVAYQIDIEEAIQVDVDIYTAVSSSAVGGFEKDVLIGRAVSGLQYSTGQYEWQWNGTEEGGAVIADGNYILEFVVTDGCGLVERRAIPVSVDTTAPLLDIVYPKTNDLISLIIEVTGTVIDQNPGTYQLSALETASGTSLSSIR